MNNEIQEFSNKDPFLNVLLNMVSKDSIDFNITINVGGSVITGTTISIKKYYRLLADEFKKGNEAGKVIAESFEKLADEYEYNEDSDVNYIHLKNAHIISDSDFYNVKIWRGKLSSVDGFSFGELIKK